jgi:hypothetical protein
VHGVGPRRVDDARVGLVERLFAAAQAELRPAGGELVGVEELVAHPVPVEHRGVPLDVARAGGGAPARDPVLDDQPAGAGDDLLAGLGLDLVPGLVGRGGQGRVLLLVLGEADDPRVVLGRAAVVPELELLDPEDPRPELGGQPVERRRAQAPEADDDRAVTHVQQCQDRRPSTSIETSDL